MTYLNVKGAGVLARVLKHSYFDHTDVKEDGMLESTSVKYGR